MRPVLTSIVFSLAILIASVAFAQAKTERISKPAATTPEATVVAALKAALAGDFEAYLVTVHPDHKATSKQIAQRKRYEWKRFAKQAAWYPVSRTPIVIVVTRRDPQGESHYRIFVKDQTHKERMPVPVRLRKSGNAWKIVTNSL
jgi:hypothetical protein